MLSCKKGKLNKEDVFILQKKAKEQRLKEEFFLFFHSTAKDNQTIKKKKLKKAFWKNMFSWFKWDIQ